MKTKKEIQVPLGDIYMAGYEPGDDLIPHWIKEDPEYAEYATKIAADEIILPKGEYKLIITYPLSKPYTEDLSILNEGFTRKDFVDFIVNRYKNKIYKDAHNGNPYGIWGHSLEDLALHTMYLEGTNITLGVNVKDKTFHNFLFFKNQTNSSTEIFIDYSRSIKPCKEMINEMLKTFGVEQTCDDIFEVKLINENDECSPALLQITIKDAKYAKLAHLIKKFLESGEAIEFQS